MSEQTFQENERASVDVLDTSTLMVQATKLRRAVQKMHKYDKKIRKKERQMASKNLNNCREKYREGLNDVKDSIAEIDVVMRLERTERIRAMERSASLRGMEKMERECDRCRIHEFKIRKLETDLEKSNREIETLQAANEDALTRLSKATSGKQGDIIPNIADLSDPHRPTKIAEQMSELYDNEWTEAFEELEQSQSTETTITLLFDTITDIFRECLAWSTSGYFEKIQEDAERSYEMKPTKMCLPDELKLQLKDFKKIRAKDVYPSITRMVYKTLPKLKQFTSGSLKAYVNKCVEVCWYAAVQDPPLSIDTTVPIKFDKSLYREYTATGEYTAFLVWPVLRLSEGGDILNKGVAQGSKWKKSDSMGL